MLNANKLSKKYSHTNPPLKMRRGSFAKAESTFTMDLPSVDKERRRKYWLKAFGTLRMKT
jgi:hypothetical protein